MHQSEKYKDDELSDEDEYLCEYISMYIGSLKECIIIVQLLFSDCEDCEEIHHGDCPVHGPLQILDSSGFDEASKYYTTLPIPRELTVKPSGIPKAGLGVFANEFIPRGVRFGPYEGKRVPKTELNDRDTSYMWEVSVRFKKIC